LFFLLGNLLTGWANENMALFTTFVPDANRYNMYKTRSVSNDVLKRPNKIIAIMTAEFIFEWVNLKQMAD
jgi:hypothetical protein